ncbi:hypothetical protein [Streptomyces silvensis]|uniref:hypothetical protein n=1 Tax=Streptomyces silvensis TaxID=1765722 RepID=UPI000A979616|nr:hypothetical protein [Streptomyces silvensis]
MRAVLAVRLDAAEVERRAGGGGAPLLDVGALEALLQLPAGLPVPATSLTARERARLRGCPDSALERSDGYLTRRLVRPLEVDVALARTARPVRGALLRAGRFGECKRQESAARGRTGAARGREESSGMVGACDC